MAGVIRVIDAILLGLMVAEILYTVIISFESHSLKAEPFLIVGLIAAVRRVLLISLEATHVYKLSQDVFNSYMIEMGTADNPHFDFRDFDLPASKAEDVPVRVGLRKIHR